MIHIPLNLCLVQAIDYWILALGDMDLVGLMDVNIEHDERSGVYPLPRFTCGVVNSESG